MGNCYNDDNIVKLAHYLYASVNKKTSLLLYVDKCDVSLVIKPCICAMCL